MRLAQRQRMCLYGSVAVSLALQAEFVVACGEAVPDFCFEEVFFPQQICSSEAECRCVQMFDSTHTRHEVFSVATRARN